MCRKYYHSSLSLQRESTLSAKRSNGIMPKIVLAVLTLTLVGSLLILSGCAKTSVIIPRPTLESITENNGGICIDKHDTAELLHYIDLLEDN